MKNRISNIVWGFIFIVAGIGFAGNAFDLWNFSIFFRGWWTLIIIIPCLVNIIQYGMNGGNITGLCIGVALLLSAQGILDVSFVRKLVFPIILVLIGVSILFGNSNRKIKDQSGKKIPYDTKNPNLSAVFGERRENFAGQVFAGATLSTAFGALNIDLRDAVIEQDVRIDATAVFGGIDIQMPSNVIVKVLSTPVLGGVSNKAPSPKEGPCFTIFLNATCVFGGIDIK